MPAERKLSIAIHDLGRTPLLNAERSQHWRKRAQTTKLWRTRALIAWRKALRAWKAAEAADDRHHIFGNLIGVRVHAYPTQTTGRAMPDVGACIPAVKAAIDAAVDAGIMLDDSARYVRAITFHAPSISGKDGLVLTLTGTLDESAS